MSIEKTLETLAHDELSDADIVYLLGLTAPEECELLRKAAYDRTTELMGNFVYYRGLIEFSNICTASCRYCGIRRENHDVARYTMSKEEIVAAAKWAAEQGYGSICRSRASAATKSTSHSWRSASRPSMRPRSPSSFPTASA